MSWQHAFLVFFVCISLPCFAQDSAEYSQQIGDAKLAISKRTLSPIFATINLDAGIQERPISQEEFERVNDRFFQIHAEYFEESELLLQEKIFRSAVGKKIGENMLRALFGRQPFALKYGDFSKAEQDEFELVMQGNQLQFEQLKSKMKGFPSFMRSKLTH